MENKKIPEFTDEQIIAGFKFCFLSYTDCDACPLVEIMDNCNEKLIAELILALIDRLKAENEELKEYKKVQPVGCPVCGRGNFSNDKFCSHCGKQLKGKPEDTKIEVIKELLLRAKGLEQIIGEDNELKPYILIEDLKRIAGEML